MRDIHRIIDDIIQVEQVHKVMLMDNSGYLLAERGNLEMDTTSFTSLSAAFSGIAGEISHETGEGSYLSCVIQTETSLIDFIEVNSDFFLVIINGLNPEDELKHRTGFIEKAAEMKKIINRMSIQDEADAREIFSARTVKFGWNNWMKSQFTGENNS